MALIFGLISALEYFLKKKSYIVSKKIQSFNQIISQVVA